jgi:type III pantothenate kinase
VVADCGTAITVDCVSDEGVFLGGAILPGLSLGASALAGGTALLPKVALERPTWVFGKDTRQAIIGGLVQGARGAIQFLTEAYATELKKWPLLLLTGGDAELIREEQGLEQAVVPELTLLGVALAFHLAKGELRLEEEE